MGSFKLSSIIFSLLLAVLTACSSRQDIAKSIAFSGGLSPGIAAAPAFDLVTYTRLSPGHPLLTVYLEGDGYAWITPTRLSDDPTPRDPVALRLAARDPSPSVAYVARPCHYVTGAQRRGCSPVYWANGRFAPEVVEAEAAAVRKLMAQAGASRLRLVGYSGGGAIALLLARQGIVAEQIITVAAILDSAAWTRLHDLSPLAGSLNPADNPALLTPIPQVHFAGAEDRVAPGSLAENFKQLIGAPAATTVITVPGFTHDCCWAEDWPRLLRQAETILGMS